MIPVICKSLAWKADLHTAAVQRVDKVLQEHGQVIGMVYTDVETLKGQVTALEQKMDNGFLALEKRLDAIADVQKLILARLPEKGE